MASGRKCPGAWSASLPLRSTSCSEQPPVKADKLDRTGQGWTGLEGAGSREGGACSKECTDVKIPGKKRRGRETGVRMEHPRLGRLGMGRGRSRGGAGFRSERLGTP